MAKELTAKERRLLKHPPTPTTWECLGHKVEDDGSKTRCAAINSGRQPKCWLCGKKKSSRPKLIYPAYEAACKKAGIEPGTRFPPAPVPEAATEGVEKVTPAKKTTRRKK